MGLISLLTDFGEGDGNVGVMKGVIWGICPQALLADLSHQIEPHNVRQAAWLLGRHGPYFPAGTVHLVVVDPGVGTERRPLAARLGEQLFVGPDNGVVSRLLGQAEGSSQPVRFIHLDQPRFWRPEVSHVFHGRDIFAPVAAHLACGVPLRELGAPMADPVRLPLPEPRREAEAWQAEVVYVDRFGNLATSLRREHLGQVRRLVVRIRGRDVPGLAGTFGQARPGELVALYGSSGDLLIAQVQGSAARTLGVRAGEPVTVMPG